MSPNFFRAAALCLCLPLAACGEKLLTEERVTKLIDAADMAYVKGDATKICNLRARGFTLQSSYTDLTADRIVDSLADAEELAAKREADGEKLDTRNETQDLKEFCFNALTSARQYAHANMQRSRLEIHVAADGHEAQVLAHYSIREPLLAEGDNGLGRNDHDERQLATRQIEADDETRVTLNEDGEALIASTTSKARGFLVPSDRDARL